jgi:glutathione S-transferase
LLEELGLPYELERVHFQPPAKNFFVQSTPLGKLPTIEDGDVVMCESGAIVEYILERYGDGRLAPPAGSRERAAFLQWLHFSESTAFPPLGIVVWLTRYREDAEHHAAILEDARARAAAGLDFLESQIGQNAYLVGDEFSAADIMMGFTLVAARVLGVLDDRYPMLNGYLARLAARPAFQKAIAVE